MGGGGAAGTAFVERLNGRRSEAEPEPYLHAARVGAIERREVGRELVELELAA